MNILLTGASGLIGEAVLARLLAQGHRVTALCRRRPSVEHPALHWLQADMAAMVAPAAWDEALACADAVVNCAGIFREAPGQSFDDVHAAAPAALFAACAEHRIERVVQLSALGADAAAPSAFLRSKAAGDAALTRLPIDWIVVRPSLVYGDAGTSSRLFRRFATLPLLVVPASAGAVQPIHLDDLAELITRAATDDGVLCRRIVEAVGPRPLPWGGYLAALREGMGMAPARILAVPQGLAALGVSLASRLRPGLVSPDALTMLAQGSTGNAAPAAAILARPLRDPACFAHADLRGEAVLQAWLPILRLSLVAVWLWTAFVSLYWPGGSFALLADAGVPSRWFWPAVLAGAGLDLVLGVLALCWPSRLLWQMQTALVAGYTAFITLREPHWWLHPFGPVSKNLPIFAVLGLLAATARPSTGEARIH